MAVFKTAHHCQIKSVQVWQIIKMKNFKKTYIHARVDVVANFDIHFHNFSNSKTWWKFEVNLQGTEYCDRLWSWESQPHIGRKGKGP